MCDKSEKKKSEKSELKISTQYGKKIAITQEFENLKTIACFNL